MTTTSEEADVDGSRSLAKRGYRSLPWENFRIWKYLEDLGRTAIRLRNTRTANASKVGPLTTTKPKNWPRRHELSSGKAPCPGVSTR